MTKFLNKDWGRRGEDIAAKHLRKKGYQILEKNYSAKFGELDLIASKGKILVFVEVKLKNGENFGTPEEMIGPKKLFQVQRTANLFLMKEKDIADKYNEYRIDAVCIVIAQDEQVERINHYENLTF